jgi:hypothetical protein
VAGKRRVASPVKMPLPQVWSTLYNEITNDWNYDASCTLTSFPVSDLESLKRFIFVAQSIQINTYDIAKRLVLAGFLQVQ